MLQRSAIGPPGVGSRPCLTASLQPGGERLHAGRLPRRATDDEELVAADARDHVGLARRGPKCLRRQANRRIAGTVAVRVVDLA